MDYGYIHSALELGMGGGWERIEGKPIWQKEGKFELVCLISETNEFYKFTYFDSVGSTKDSTTIKAKFIYLSKTEIAWDMDEEVGDDIPTDGNRIEDDNI